eukprot:COSAG02_NODE_17045_length_1033_cov_0.720557_1_plen_113_part_00
MTEPKIGNGPESFEVEGAEGAEGASPALAMGKDGNADNPMYTGGKTDASGSPNFKADDWGEEDSNPFAVASSDDVFEEEPAPETEGDEIETVSEAVLYCCSCAPLSPHRRLT